MGTSNWSAAAYQSVRQAREASTATEIFRASASVDPLMDPRQLVHREARDSEHHPRSTPIIVAFDVTASMGHIPTDFAKVQLGRLMSQLTENGWATDPQLLFAAIGDAVSDRAPLQVGQFESGLEMDQWLTRIWLEGQGGDVPESYTLAHWFARYRTRTDAWEQRRQRGFLFTLGDAPHKPLQASHLARVFGGRPADYTETVGEVVPAAVERWDCWHFIVPTQGAISPAARVDWEALLGEQVLDCTVPTAICALIGVIVAGRSGRLDREQGARVLREAGVPEAEAASLWAVL